MTDHLPTITRGEAYILRTCNADMTSRDGLVWPREGHISAPDWRADKPGHGLQGLLWGEGNGVLLSLAPDAVWLVARVTEWIDLRGKVKFPHADVVFAGSQHEATQWIRNAGASGAVVGIALTGGDRSTLTGGDLSVLTGGHCCSLTGGDRSTLAGGDSSVLTARDSSILTGGQHSILIAGYRSEITGGDDSVLTGGDSSILTGGDRSTLIGGEDSDLTGGEDSVLTAGARSTLKGGDRSILTGGQYNVLVGGEGSTLTGGEGSTLAGGVDSVLVFTQWYDGAKEVYVGVVGHGGIQPGVAYRLWDGQIVREQDLHR